MMNLKQFHYAMGKTTCLLFQIVIEGYAAQAQLVPTDLLANLWDMQDQISYTCVQYSFCLKLNCETNKLITSKLPKPVPYPNLHQYLKEQGTISPKRYFWRQYSDTTGEVTDTSGEVIDISGEGLAPGTRDSTRLYTIKWCNSFTS